MAHNRKHDDIPDHRKFGYQYLVEMDEIRDQMRREGVTDYAELHMGAVQRYMDRHKNDPTYRETSERILKAARRVPSQLDVYRDALQAIADGHNDPRRLARMVLGMNVDDNKESDI